jgi:hypothetical protein
MTDTEALEKAKDIAGKTRDIGGVLYTEQPGAVHGKIDELLWQLLEPDYPELIGFIRKLRLWYT